MKVKPRPITTKCLCVIKRQEDLKMIEDVKYPNLEKITITKSELKPIIRGICDYVILEGKYTNWDKVIDSFKALENTYDLSVLDDEHDYNNRVHKVFQSYYLNTKGFGDNEAKIMQRVLHIYQIRKITGKWYDK